SMSRSRAAPPRLAPTFGVEIEIFVRLKPSFEENIRRKRLKKEHLPDYFQEWQEDLPNDSNDRLAVRQRLRVCFALKALIEQELGPDSGWRCELDLSLRQHELTAPPDPRKWWGIEMISPPMSINKHWQQEIEQVFEAVGQQFNFWTTEHTSCHVHITPGPDRSSKYTEGELANVAKGAYFWETALLDLLPVDRKKTKYARPNYELYAGLEYSKVGQDSWGPLFKKIDATADKGREIFVQRMMGIPELDEDGSRYGSHNFEPVPVEVLGTVEFRRQAGVASAETTIHRILLAITLHISARTYDFKRAQSRRSHPSSDELIAELARCERLLPAETCKPRYSFVRWLQDCQRDYRGGRRFTEKEINDREAALRPRSIRDLEPATTSAGRATSGRSAQGTGTASAGRANVGGERQGGSAPLPVRPAQSTARTSAGRTNAVGGRSGGSDLSRSAQSGTASASSGRASAAVVERISTSRSDRPSSSVPR
ncbi:putative amidoligase enzyme-domain-containing protein, partial [Chaetomium strumarium]